ncbi:alpha/beta fold hydrolase [Hydrogenophaga sp.]|uniref:alpha/beta fold hydrolase n=1 Tax=Hydrogenophaga sp. TaxID=1904254 RepID=UPI0027276E71|nr:alpha/beta hydrolase [Hydrogenophaga sp.]MDO9433963.1 alpha/beta hydrolase [Hydrogenophaga sp.]
MPLLHVGDAELFFHDDDFADPWEPHDAVMLQHGLGRSGKMWYGWVPHLSRDFRVLRMDLRGAGESPDPGKDIAFTLESVLADFVRMLDALNIEKVHYVGESLGSMLGVAFANAYPERVKSLTLVAAITRVRHDKTITVNSVGYPSWPEAVEALGMKEWWLRSRAATHQLTGDAAKDNWFAEQCGRTPVHVAHALLRFAPAFSVESMLRNVAVPTLLLTPGGSTASDPEEQDMILKTIPDARQIQYPDAWHIDCYLRPDQFARDTLGFLRGVSGVTKPAR